jgi:hypothetical protein
MQDFEKLGVFYLGRSHDPQEATAVRPPLLYDARDLTTHGICLGMTGSGKTGLCLALIEEAAIDGIPILAIDPKGDLGNLLLTFPELRPTDFRPWIDEAEAARQGMSPEDYAAQVARRWKEGLADWGQDGARIRRFENAVDRAIYTPASNAGLALSALKSFAAPAAALREDSEALRDRVLFAVSGLLVLIGIQADPLASREHILLSHVLGKAWQDGKDVDLAGLIRAIQSPPFDRVGVLDLESFFPSNERFQLATRLNNLMASPGFAAWMEGQPLDVGRLLYTAEGRPRLSVLSIAHLSETERMFFVTLLLSEVLAWVRSQPGTSSLRALLYMDEIFGFFPPVAAPPSKAPMLALLKQARASGLGVLLATQNPVDLDYKGLANVGTWLIGRLQTDRDRSRVLDALEGARDRASIEQDLAQLGSRIFLLHSVHEDEPVVFQSRWALSYLRGPLTRDQIARLMEKKKRAEAGALPVAAPVAPAEEAVVETAERPVVPPEINESFFPENQPPPAGQLLYRPALLGTARLHYSDRRAGVDTWESLGLLATLSEDPTADVWEEAQPLRGSPSFGKRPEAGARFSPLPPAAARPASYERWGKELSRFLQEKRSLRLWKSPALGEISRSGESEGDFRMRLSVLVHEKRDGEVEKLRKKYASRVASLEQKIRRAEERLSREEAQYGQRQSETWITLGTGVLGALFGRKLASAANVGRAASAARSASRVAREKEEIERAQAELDRLRTEQGDLEAEVEAEVAKIQESWDPSGLELEEVIVRPTKSDLTVNLVLVWQPWRLGPDGSAEAGFSI